MQIAVLLFTIAAGLPPADAANLQAAHELFEAVGEDVWPGWRAAPFDALLIAGDVEYAISPRTEIAGFAPAGELGAYRVLRRPRTLSPHLLATFPALMSATPVIVVGTPETTGKSTQEWVVTVLHEHFHQHQTSQPWYYERTARLGLSNGDETGMWMLNYAFPYGDTGVQKRYEAFTAALAEALRARGGAGFSPALREVKSRWRELREGLSADDYAYFRFQAWQEGVARYVELRVAEKGFPAVGEKMMKGIFASLDAPDLAKDQRVAFYAAGAAIALLLDETSPGWKEAYFARPFEMETYFAP